MPVPSFTIRLPVCSTVITIWPLIEPDVGTIDDVTEGAKPLLLLVVVVVLKASSFVDATVANNNLSVNFSRSVRS